MWHFHLDLRLMRFCVAFPPERCERCLDNHLGVRSFWTCRLSAGVYWAFSQSMHCVYVKQNCMLMMSEVEPLFVGGLGVNSIYCKFVHVLPFLCTCLALSMCTLQQEHSQCCVSVAAAHVWHCLPALRVSLSHLTAHSHQCRVLPSYRTVNG